MKFSILMGLILVFSAVAQAETICKKGSEVIEPVISNTLVSVYDIELSDSNLEVEVNSKSGSKEVSGIISVRIISKDLKSQTEVEAKDYLYIKVNGETVICQVN